MTVKEIRAMPEIKALIEAGDRALQALEYTEHGYAHVGIVSHGTAVILQAFGYDEHTCELGRIAGYIHDIGNSVNRVNHAHTGALLAFSVLNGKMDPADLAAIMTAIGNHDEGTAAPVTPIAAALILADKTDVRRSRVQVAHDRFDIHDRVNYAVEDSSLNVDAQAKTITLQLSIDSELCPVMDYFEIFQVRMQLCRSAATALGAQFKLIINDTQIL